jgi:hypothetical protein
LGTPQHEAVHAYCYHAFGVTGPTWYAEGMAEMGNYWVEGDASVNCPDYVIDFLRNDQRPTLDAITDSNQESGDGWRNYAWRWALCHFLVNNPNYQDRFRTLGATLLSGRGGSFERSFSSQRRELDFEFAFFLDHLERGFDVSRCRWDWKKSFREPKGSRSIRCVVQADQGWQPTGARLISGNIYQLTCAGLWSTAEDAADAAPAAAADTAGALVGCLMRDDRLSAPFLLTTTPAFLAPGDGELYVRCHDAWTSLHDNRGEVRLELSAPPQPAE